MIRTCLDVDCPRYGRSTIQLGLIVKVGVGARDSLN
jgi:hypothetical protein